MLDESSETMTGHKDMGILANKKHFSLTHLTSHMENACFSTRLSDYILTLYCYGIVTKYEESSPSLASYPSI